MYYTTFFFSMIDLIHTYAHIWMYKWSSLQYDTIKILFSYLYTYEPEGYRHWCFPIFCLQSNQIVFLLFRSMKLLCLINLHLSIECCHQSVVEWRVKLIVCQMGWHIYNNNSPVWQWLPSPPPTYGNGPVYHSLCFFFGYQIYWSILLFFCGYHSWINHILRIVLINQ